MKREVARAIRDLLKMNSLGLKISCFPVLPVAYATQFVSKIAKLECYGVLIVFVMERNTWINGFLLQDQDNMITN